MGYQEFLRPWKVLTFLGGMVWLIFGARNYRIADWDVSISLLMGPLTYVCAPWSVRTVADAVRARGGRWVLRVAFALLVSWAVVDGVYFVYHSAVGKTMFRRENFFLSSALYIVLGAIWGYRGSVRELYADAKAFARYRPSR